MQLEILRTEPDVARPVTLVFIHGAWHGAWCWEANFLPWFTARGWRCVAPSLRGHAGSGPFRRSQRVHHYVSDVEHVLDGIEGDVVLLGHSMGGFIVQHLMARDVAARGAVLVAPAPPWSVVGSSLRLALEIPGPFLQASLQRRLWPLVADRERAGHMFLRADASEAQTRWLHDHLGDESLLALLDMLFLDLPQVKRKLPALVVGGAADRLFTVQQVTGVAEAHGAELCMLDDVAHDVMLDPDWELAAQRIEDWLMALGGEAWARPTAGATEATPPHT